MPCWIWCNIVNVVVGKFWQNQPCIVGGNTFVITVVSFVFWGRLDLSTLNREILALASSNETIEARKEGVFLMYWHVKLSDSGESDLKNFYHLIRPYFIQSPVCAKVTISPPSLYFLFFVQSLAAHGLSRVSSVGSCSLGRRGLGRQWLTSCNGHANWAWASVAVAHSLAPRDI